MIQINKNGFTLICDETNEGKLIIKGYEGNDAILDISDIDVISIDKKAFLSCKCLKKIVFPETIEKVGEWAFSKCTNLKSVKFKSDFKTDIFGKGVFDGCTALEKISFSDFTKDLEVLYSATVNRLSNDILFRGNDVGEKVWFDKWDLNLISMLKTNDLDGGIEVAACGEEDISYSGMVDGEMPSDTDEYVKNKEKNKCFLCYQRLLYSYELESASKEILESYIKERSFTNKNKSAWYTLKEDCQDDVDYYKLYLEIVSPDKKVINDMIADLNQTQVQTKAFLINEASKADSTDSFFDDLFL